MLLVLGSSYKMLAVEKEADRMTAALFCTDLWNSNDLMH